MNFNDNSWKEIKGYEGLYKINKNGLVFSLISFKEVKPFADARGYIRVALRKNKTQKKHRVHRLISEAFIPNPHNKKYVNHIDGNPSNNAIENLEWVTNSENMIHAYRSLGKVPGRKGKFGALNHKSKMVVMKDMFGNVLSYFDGVRDAARINGFDNGCISKCCNGKLNAHKGYKWSFC